ncbi:hypothetical protein ACTXT7_008336 [Hymenolepis weldensis]
MPNKLGGLQYLTAIKAAAYKGYLISSDEDDDSDYEQYSKPKRHEKQSRSRPDDDSEDDNVSPQFEKKTNKKKQVEKAAKKKATLKGSPRSKKTFKTSSKTISKKHISIEEVSSSSGEEESVHISSDEGDGKKPPKSRREKTIAKEIPEKETKEKNLSISRKSDEDKPPKPETPKDPNSPSLSKTSVLKGYVKSSENTGGLLRREFFMRKLINKRDAARILIADWLRGLCAHATSYPISNQ